MKFEKGTRVAVFSRNHPDYLREATARNREDPDRPTTFRSAKRWTSAFEAILKSRRSLKIYFALTREQKEVKQKEVRYQADLLLVHPDPRRGDPVTEQLMSFQLESTKDEFLWDEKVRTLYVINKCEKLDQPFSLSELIKVDDGKTLSENYSYSYSLVREHQSTREAGIYISPEEVPHPSKYFEGATRTVSVNKYERSAGARLECMKHYGHDCAVCGFNFEAVYGELGKDFIHVHHLKSLSDIEKQYEVNPILDLRPVCPNCHAMIHRANPELSIEELRRRLEKRGLQRKTA